MQGISVLVVDDDKDFTRIVSRLLETQGYTVTVAFDALAAVDRVQEEVYDLVLTDANMPYRSGFDLIKTLRNNPRSKDVAIALVTGRRDKKDVQRGLDCGADDYIVKPVDPDLFLDKVQSLLHNKAQKQLRQLQFAQTSLNMPVHWDTGAEIKALSEKGIQIEGPTAASPNTRLRVQSPLFELIGIQTPPLRVVQCQPVHGNPFRFHLSLQFVGLSDSELQKVRFWINTNLNIQGSSRAS
ncbi:MAG: response regulator [Oligoflexia bacterium]|nr:response regulator [Oligoflexia bacterium]